MSIEYNFPKSFVHRIQKQFGNDTDDFLKALKEEAPNALRINPDKNTGQFANEENVPWTKLGKYLKERPEYVFDPLIHAGGYYVQEPSSMLFANAIDFSKDLRILDLCAAPGGKSTLLLSLMSKNSLLVSNEIVSKRAQILYENISKWGHPNTLITNQKTSDLKLFTGYFDVILVDAPCSGEGMFRKDPKTIREWSETKPFQCSVSQRNILDDAVQLLAHNGLLIYSTCTFSPEENEQIAQWFYDKYKDLLQPEQMNMDPSWGVQTEILEHNNGSKQELYKCYPYKMRGEGMFISLFRSKNKLHSAFSKKNKAVKELRQPSGKIIQEVKKFVTVPEGYDFFQMDQKIHLLPLKYLPELALAQQFNCLKTGVMVGAINFKSNEFIPSQELAFSPFVNQTVPGIELDRINALRFLRKEDVELNDIPIAKTWYLASYKGIHLGWLKNTGKRLNNSYPKEWKIRKNLNLH